MIDKFQQLAQNHPALFEKNDNFEFSINDGWFVIIDTLCGMICAPIEAAKRRLKYALENPDAKMGEGNSIAHLEKLVKEEFEKLPRIVQVKEKFGSLRFYVDGGTPEIHNYIEFAEAMSGHICEECGAPGESRNTGWIKVLCDKHHKEREESAFEYKKSFNKSKLSDEN